MCRRESSKWRCDWLCCVVLKNNISNEALWTAHKFFTQPARDFEQSTMVKLVVNALVLANSTGHGNTDFRHTRSVLDNHWVRHIISPSSALSSPKKAPKQLSLARALAVENDPRLRQGLAKDKVMKVVSINASARVMSKQKQKRYEQMKLYREALQLPKPTSQSCPCRHSCTLAFYLFCIYVFCYYGRFSLCFAKLWWWTLVVHVRLC